LTHGFFAPSSILWSLDSFNFWDLCLEHTYPQSWGGHSNNKRHVDPTPKLTNTWLQKSSKFDVIEVNSWKLGMVAASLWVVSLWARVWPTFCFEFIFVCCLHSSTTHVAFWMKFEPFAFFLIETQLGFCSRFPWTAHKRPFVITSFLAVLQLTNYKGSTYVGHSNIIILQGQLQHMYTCWIINLFFDFTSKNRICLTIRFALLRASHIMCFGWRIMKVMLVWGSKNSTKKFNIFSRLGT
jgi:hypothetical protein